MDKINWAGYEWITQERWGQVHPEKPTWWYDSKCVYVDNHNNLHLLTNSSPKFFPELGITASIGAGLVSCLNKFSFGTFSIVAKLPKGPHLWPAFWMWSWDSWPPEIDVIEGYPNSNGSYFRPKLFSPCSFWKVETNVHYKTNGENKSTGGKPHFFGFKDPSENFIEYSVDWDPNYIKFYYDGKLVRTINDKHILEQFNKTTMNVIINNGVTKKANTYNPPISDFIVKNFSYKQKV